MKYAPLTMLAFAAFLLIGLSSCGPEKDPELISTMQSELDSLQSDIDAVGNAKQRLGGIMRALESLTPEQRDTLQAKLEAYQGKIGEVLNAFRETQLPEADQIPAFQKVIADYENGLIKKKEAKEQLEQFRQAVSGIDAKVAALDAKVLSVETELPTILPVGTGMSSALPQGAYQGAPGAAPSSGTAGGVAPAGAGTQPGSVPTGTAPAQSGGSLVAPEKKQ